MAWTIIWIHGWGTSPRAWGDAPLLLPWAEHRFVSFAGCASAGELRDAIRREVAAAYAVAVREQSPAAGRRVAVVGWSLGAMLALECLFEELLPVSALAIVGGTLRFVDRDRTRGWPERVLMRMRAQLATEPEETLRAFANAMFATSEQPGADDNTERFDGWLGRLRETDFSAAGLAAGLEYLQSADLRERWRKWREAMVAEEVSASDDRKISLLWLHGEGDPICPAGAIPDDLLPEERTMLPGAGHAPFLTAQEEFRERLERWLHVWD